MNPKNIWANFAVSDLDRTTKFYTELGFKFNGRSKDLTSFKFGDNDFIIHFFQKDILEKNIKSKIADPHSSNEIIFTISAESKTQTDDWAKEIEKAGGTLVSQPEEFGEGYYGFTFADPDGHLFNVFYM
ncbi:MAG TPA: VOC family protein [Mucilaginibacter sp.]